MNKNNFIFYQNVFLTLFLLIFHSFNTKQQIIYVIASDSKLHSNNNLIYNIYRRKFTFLGSWKVYNLLLDGLLVFSVVMKKNKKNKKMLFVTFIDSAAL